MHRRLRIYRSDYVGLIPKCPLFDGTSSGLKLREPAHTYTGNHLSVYSGFDSGNQSAGLLVLILHPMASALCLVLGAFFIFGTFRGSAEAAKTKSARQEIKGAGVTKPCAFFQS